MAHLTVLRIRYWNLYPGAMSDTESYVYRYSWDADDLENYPWPEHYVKQPEVLAYLNHVADKHDLKRNMRFETQLLSADWQEETLQWRVTMLHKGEKKSVAVARYVVMGLGLLSKQNYPDIEGIESFQGEVCSKSCAKMFRHH